MLKIVEITKHYRSYKVATMLETLSPLASESCEQILCFYTNSTSQIQIARLTNIEKFNFEKIVFPGERLFFDAMPDAQLEIEKGMKGSTKLVDKIRCDLLRVYEKSSGLE
jgi:hypothetical protein